MLRIVLLLCIAGFAQTQTFTQGQNCKTLPSLVESISNKDHTSVAAQCRRHFGLKDCEQLILSVGRGHFSPEVQQRTCAKIADLLQSRNLKDTPLDEVAAVKESPENVDVATVKLNGTLAPLPKVELPTVAPLAQVELPTVAPLPQMELPTVAPLPQVELATVAPLETVQIVTVAPKSPAISISAKVGTSAGQEAKRARKKEHQAQPATPELLDALGQTFVSPSADLTPEQRRGHEDEDRPSWLAPSAERSADQSRPIADALRGAASGFFKGATATGREHTGGEADGTSRQSTKDRPSWLAPSAERSADQSRPIADALRGAANGFFKGRGRQHTARGEADGTNKKSKKEQSWQKEQSFHERGPFGINLNNFISSHANEDPHSQAQAPNQEFGDNRGQANEQWMESKFDLRRRVADSATHKMLMWGFLFVTLVSLASSMVIRCRPISAPTAYSRLEAQVPHTSSRQVRVA